VVGDDNQILQVFMNLFLNAAQAMPRGGRLTVTTAAAAGDVIARVADEGMGIPPENIGKIFDPFFTTKQDWTGTGLGLSVTFAILNNHGGTIEVESAVGRGSVFTVRLPAAPQLSPRGPDAGRVLIVDDESEVRGFVATLLKGHGLAVSEAPDGESALEILAREPYALVVLDQLMTGKTGVETYREIKRRHPHTRAILLTGTLEVEPDEFTQEGFAAVVRKPCSARDLLDAVRKALEAV
jgi:CheY-like chemotaxis protein